MKCHACGQDNAANALFCAACRRPLVAPTQLPTRMEPLAPPAMAAAARAFAPGDGGAAASPSSRNRFEPPRADGTGTGRAHDDASVMTDEDAWGAVIGDANTSDYLERFGRLAHGDGGGWHWPGFFVTWYWMLYRKMWTAAAIWFVAPCAYLMVLVVIGMRSPALVGFGVLAGWVVHLLLPGIMANKWYYDQCQRRIRDVRARGGSKAQMLGRLEELGGTSNIPVIIVAIFVIFVGIVLAAVALPAYQQYTVKAKMSEAVLVGGDVTAAVGRSYEQTGQLPTDIDDLLAQATHHSAYVKGAALDGASGKVTLRVEAAPNIVGSLDFTPSADNHHHLSWTCSTDDLKRYAPPSCRQ